MILSVIMPIYNAEDKIKYSVASILNQTFTNFELIMIDDGSTDNSGIICDKYAQKDARIKVIHQKNGGAGAARKVGIDCAQGKYITFVDADDVIHPQMYEIMIYKMKENKLDLLMCQYRDVKKIGEIEVDQYYDYKNEKITLINQRERYENLLGKNIASGGWVFLWNKIYKADVLKEAVPMYSTEDIEYNVRYFHKIENFGVIDLALYFYVYESNSLSRRKFGKYNYDTMQYHFNCASYMKTECSEMYDLMLIRLYQFLFDSVVDSKDTEFYLKVKKLIHKNIKEFHKDLLHTNKISIVKKFKIIFLYMFPFVYMKLRK